MLDGQEYDVSPLGGSRDLASYCTIMAFEALF